MSIIHCAALLLALLLSQSSYTSAQRLTFTQLTAAAPWDVRTEALLVSHPSPVTYYPPTSTTPATSAPNSLILYGGRGPGAQFDNDVWLYDAGQSSWTIISGTDGTSNVSASAASGPATYASWPGNALCADASGQTLYVVSGFIPYTYYDVSTNAGVSWSDHQTDSVSTAPFPARSYGTCSVDPRTGVAYMMGGLQYVYGGSDPTLNDVWSYTPTTGNWTQVTAAAAWPSRNALSSAAVYNAALSTTLLYVTAGLTEITENFGFTDVVNDVGSSDVWVSSNGGQGWSMLANNSFPNRALANFAISPSGILVVAEGTHNEVAYPHDIWASADGGVSWGQCSNPASASYPDRRTFSMNFDALGYLWLMGGECYSNQAAYCTSFSPATPGDPTHGGKYNDVWRSAFSFNNLTAVASACGLTVSPCGAGARCWPINGPCACTVSSSSSSSTAAVSPGASSSSSSSSTRTVVVNPISTSSSSSTSTTAPASPSSATNTPAFITSSSSSSSTTGAPIDPPASASSSSSGGAAGAVNPSSSSSTGFGDGAAPPASDSGSSGGGGIAIGAIIGIIVGVIAAILILCLAYVMYSRYRKNHSSGSSYGSGSRSGSSNRAADDTDSGSDSSNGMMDGRPLGHRAVQIWGTGELELNGSKQLSSGAGTSSQLDRTSSISHRSSDISGTTDSINSVQASSSQVYVHD